jgi:hypothetical protein
MASFIYNACLLNTFRQRFDFDSDKIKVLLVTAAYQPDKETHATRADLTDEVLGQGYAAGGVDANVLVNMKDDTLVLNLGGVTLTGREHQRAICGLLCGPRRRC